MPVMSVTFYNSGRAIPNENQDLPETAEVPIEHSFQRKRIVSYEIHERFQQWLLSAYLTA